MTDDIARDQPWNDFKDTPETRDAVTKVQEHYLPIVNELRTEVERLNKTIMMQRMFLVCIGLFSVYLAVFR